MKRATLLASTVASLLVALLFAAPASATEVGRGRSFGLGFQVGDPTALVGKAFIGNGNAIDFGVGFWGYGGCWDRDGRRYWCGSRGVTLHGDYLWQDNLVRGTAKLDWHLGVGGRIYFARYRGPEDDRDLALAARMPIGLDLTFNRPSFLEVFFEVAPSLVVIPGAYFDVDAAIGVRFYL